MIQVAEYIILQDNKVLICQREDKGNCASLWEFPGGKLEPGETLKKCVVRECKEELNIEIKVIDIFARTIYKSHEQEISFTFFNAQFLDGEISLRVHKDYKWVTTYALKNYPFCPADIEIVDTLFNSPSHEVSH